MYAIYMSVCARIYVCVYIYICNAKNKQTINKTIFVIISENLLGNTYPHLHFFYFIFKSKFIPKTHKIDDLAKIT